MLVLNEKDIIQAVEIQNILKAVEDAFIIQENGHYIMPDRMHIGSDQNTFLVMPCIASNSFSTKLVSVCPENKLKDLSTIFGSVILNDKITGKPLALINGARLTLLRTAAVGALGTIYTTPVNSKSLGLIGAGIQGFHQVLFNCVVRNIQEVNIFDPFKKDMQSFIKDLKAHLPNIKINSVNHCNDLINISEIIVTSTTSEQPVLPGNPELLKGKHFIGIGSYKPSMQEFPDNLFRLLDQVFVDTDFAKKETGDLVKPLSNGLLQEKQVFTLGKVIEKKVILSSNQTTLFKSVGMALFDLMVAELIYNKAKEKGLGQEVQF